MLDKLKILFQLAALIVLTGGLLIALGLWVKLLYITFMFGWGLL